MATSKKRHLSKFVLLTLLLFFLVFIPSNNQAAENEKTADDAGIIITASEKDIPNNKLYIGELAETIKNPYCVELITLLRNTEQFKIVEKNRTKQGEAKYWIGLAMASELVFKQITEFSDANKIDFICERKNLFAILRKQTEMKGKSDNELIKQFDLTRRIISYAKANSNNSKTDKNVTSPLIKK